MGKTIEELMNEYQLICMDSPYSHRYNNDQIYICRRIDFVDCVIDDDESLLKDFIIDLSIENGVRLWVQKFGEDK